MSTTSYGSITIVDITDIGEFSVYPKCNLPTTVIYSPDNNIYTPNWQTANLELTPAVYYAGAPLTSGLQYEWKRQEGTNTPSVITGTSSSPSSYGEEVTDGVLTVKQNQFPVNGTYTQLTYIIKVTYPNSVSSLGKDLVAEGQITFSKVEQGISAKVARINGDNIIKYDGNGNIISPKDENLKSYINLTGTVTGCSITGWKYKNSSGNFVTYPAKQNANPATYPEGQTGSALNVYSDDSTFSNDKVTIKLETNDANTFDEFTIYKLRDGAAGTSTLSAILTNDDQMIPAYADGSPINIAQSGATSQIKIFRGGIEETTSWSIATQSSDSTLTFTRSTTAQTNDTVTVTGMGKSLQSGNITFTASKSGEDDLTKVFSLVKVKAGADSKNFTIYNLHIDALALNLDSAKSFSPQSFTATATKTEVSSSSATTSAFSGKFRITESYNNGTSDTVLYTSSQTESSKQYSPSTNARITNTQSQYYGLPVISKIKVELLDTGGSNVLDTQTVTITSDGLKGNPGDPGTPGDDAVSILLGNEAEVIPCNNNNYPLAQTTIRISFGAYEGTTRVAATVNSPKLFGISPTNTPASASSDGALVYVIPTSTQITTARGTLSLTFTCKNQTYNKVFSWVRSSAAKNGINGVTMLLFTPNGTLFDNGTGTLTVEGYLQDGSTNVTSSATWTWYQYLPDSSTPPTYDYRQLPTTAQTSGVNNPAYYTNQVLTVGADAITGYGSFKVEASYNNGETTKTYTQYVSLIDKTDPIQVSLHSTLGTQLVNGQGAGALYAIVTRNGEEIDPIGDTIVRTGTNNPSGGSNGDHYIKLNESARTATLYIKNNGTWGLQDISATYEWTFRDSNNTPIIDPIILQNRFGSAYNNNTKKVTGKCLYIDKTSVTNKLTADIKVTI